MRRGFAGLLLGISLVLASVSWAGFVTTHTVLDPSRSDRLADQLLDNTTLRSALVSRLTDSMESALPAELPVPRQTLEAAADATLDDPRVEALVREGIVRTHQNALNGIDEPIILNAGALSQAARDALIAERPELDQLLPPAPPLSIDLPTGGLGWLGTMRDFISKVVLFSALAALFGGTLAIIIAKNRADVLRRVSFWALGAAAFWLVVGYAIPYLATKVGPTSTALTTAIIDVLFGSMIRPALIMAAVGVGLFGLSILWANLEANQPARMLQSSGRSAQPQSQSVPGVPSQRTPSVGGQASNIRHVAHPQQPTPRQASGQQTTAQHRTPQHQTPQSSAHEPALAQQPLRNPTPSVYTGTPHPHTKPTNESSPKKWVEGVGYVDPNESD